MKKLFSMQAVCALLLLLLGGATLAGWLLRQEAVIHLLPGTSGMVVGGALSFVLLGAALALALLPWRPARLGDALGAGVLALGAAALLEYLSGSALGIDLPALHNWLDDGNPHPGRMAPSAGAGFLAAGMVLLLVPRVRSRLGGGMVQIGTFFVFLLGLVGLSSYFLHLELLYPWFPAIRTPAQTAIGMIIAGLGLWSCWSQSHWYRGQLYFRDDEKTGYVGATILTVIALTAGVVGFSAQQVTLERAFGQSLRALLNSQTMLFRTVIGQSIANADSVSRRPHLVSMVQLLNSRPGERRPLAEIERIGQSVLASGMSGVAIYDRADREILRIGRFAAHPEVETEVGRATPATLFWDGQLMLQSRSRLRDSGEEIGLIVIEQALPSIIEQFVNAEGLGATGEMGMCARRGEALLCFPQRSNPSVYSFPRLSPNGQPTPMSYAADGLSGFFKGVDFRGHNVIAAYGPLTGNGLGIVVKQDAVELYQPIRAQLHWYGLLLILLVASGAMLLRSQVTSMVSKLLQSQREATEREQHIHAVVDNVGEAIITFSAAGVMESFNLAATRIFGYPAAAALGQGIDKLMPPHSRPQHAAALESYLRGGDAHGIGKGSVDSQGLRSDGTVFPLELAINEIHSKGRRLFVAIARDITRRKQSERALQESEARSREITQTLGEGVFVTDRAGILLFSNPAAQRLLGWSEDELLGQHGHSLFHHTHADGSAYPDNECDISKVLHTGTNFRVHEEAFWRKDGSMLPVSVSAAAIWREGEVVGAVVAFHDIIERQKAAKALAAESAKNAMLLRTASDGIHVLDLDGNVVQANDAFCRMLGYSPDELRETNLRQWDVQWSAGERAERLRQMLETDLLFETRYRRRDGSTFDVEVHAGGVTIDGRRLIYAAARDISERKKAAEQMHRLAHFDQLTDLPNRALLGDRLHQALANARRAPGAHLALMFIDLDKFKPVNDTLGHHVGDLLLKQVARRIAACLRESDTVARMGGDEFVVLLPRIEADADALLVAAKILHTLGQPFRLEEYRVSISASIGVATYPEHGTDQEQLIRSADGAMYRAKDGGGGATVSAGQTDVAALPAAG